MSMERISASGPAMNASPFGATWVQGYSSRLTPSLRVAPGSWRMAPEVVRTSGVSATPGEFETSRSIRGWPAVMSISPLAIAVTVGYQRSVTMSWPMAHIPPRKVAVFLSPSKYLFLFRRPGRRFRRRGGPGPCRRG
jgi:hypothetical protein